MDHVRQAVFTAMEKLWALIQQLESDFWAAILGAVVGGVIAYFLQKQSLREARRARNEERDDQRKGLGHTLVFKTLRMHSNFSNMRDYIEQAFLKATNPANGISPWGALRPLANPPQHVNFDAEEMGMVFSIKRDDLFNDLMNIEACHRSFLDTYESYRAERDKLTGQLPGTMSGISVIPKSDPESIQKLEPQRKTVEQLADVLRVRAQEYSRESKKVLSDLINTLNAQLRLSIGLEPPTAHRDTKN